MTAYRSARKSRSVLCSMSSNVLERCETSMMLIPVRCQLSISACAFSSLAEVGKRAIPVPLACISSKSVHRDRQGAGACTEVSYALSVIM